jgi:hypothetical protein
MIDKNITNNESNALRDICGLFLKLYINHLFLSMIPIILSNAVKVITIYLTVYVFKIINLFIQQNVFIFFS